MEGHDAAREVSVLVGVCAAVGCRGSGLSRTVVAVCSSMASDTSMFTRLLSSATLLLWQCQTARQACLLTECLLLLSTNTCRYEFFAPIWRVMRDDNMAVSEVQRQVEAVALAVKQGSSVSDLRHHVFTGKLKGAQVRPLSLAPLLCDAAADLQGMLLQ